jgi:hypothetical protein
MTRMLTLAGSLSIAVITAGGAVHAAPFYNQAAPFSHTVPPQGLALQEEYGRTVPWHYKWQYHYGKWGEYVPGWVPVLNNAG